MGARDMDGSVNTHLEVMAGAPLETCHFPDFVQSPSEDAQLKPWTTRVWWLFIRHAPQSAEKQEITVKNGHMVRHREQNHKTCDRSSRRVHHKTSLEKCSERQHVFNRTCISEERENTYKVIQYNADRRGNVSNLWEKIHNSKGPVNDLNEKNLCDESSLHLDEWPWTVLSLKIMGVRQINVLRVNGSHPKDVDKYKADVDKYKADVDKYKADVDKYKADVDKYKADVDKYKADVDKYKADVDKYKADVDKYKTDLPMIERMGSTQCRFNKQKTCPPSVEEKNVILSSVGFWK
ncbi:hypothetical protein Btru_044780 [Bulinus truncatus]|nr:hypothetical protein Btru_044780 [Bulinus truncatus]